jgi:hypothetical protein
MMMDNLAGYSQLITPRVRAPWSPRPRVTFARLTRSPEGTLP